ncbi:MAG TPA: nitroreductase family deazaflavin-dependent oxidoreductase [Acidimicrobiales bacterium]|nr:nitroreductase family deazaflavin-dependent oxidoreductase [Acidimicrobiales bacterium]
MAQVPSTVKDAVTRVVTRVHETLIRATGGAVGGRVAGMPVLLLTTTGRKTGQPRTTPLTYLDDGDRLVVVASYGGSPTHPKWYLNLTANPDVEVTRGRRTERMHSRTATAEERAELWPRVTKAYKGYAGYQEKTMREIPLVILA